MPPKLLSFRTFLLALLCAGVFVAGFILTDVLSGPYDFCLEVSSRLDCEREALATTFKEKGLDATYDLFLHFYRVDPLFSADCHALGHEIGYAAYQTFRNGELGGEVLSPALIYCDYGFYHGFLEAFVWEGNSIRAVRELCHALQSNITDGRSIVNACIHGFGHGLTDGSDPRAWGSVEAMIAPGLSLCAQIALTPGEKTTCAGGVFQALSKLIAKEKYGIPFDPEDPYDVCRRQEDPDVRKGCYGGRGSFVYWRLAQESLLDILPHLEGLQTEDMENAVNTLAVTELASRDDISAYPAVAELCYKADPLFQGACIRGIVRGLILLHPAIGYHTAMRFCAGGSVRPPERNVCYKQIFERSSHERTVTAHRLLCLGVPKELSIDCMNYKSFIPAGWEDDSPVSPYAFITGLFQPVPGRYFHRLGTSDV